MRRLPRKVPAFTALVLAAAATLLASCDNPRDKSRPDDNVPSPSTTQVTQRNPYVRVDPIPTVVPGTEIQRFGDEIVAAGRYFRTGTRVILWTDPGGYDAYRTERRFTPWDQAPFVVPGPGREVPKNQPSSPARYGTRETVLSWPELDLVRGGGWPLELLQEKVDQFVLHYDVAGTARTCFLVLHDMRGLSVHFLLDIDGTIYQTLDLKERAFHATSSNPRSVGVEIAHRGAYANDVPLREFYARDEHGPYISLPARFGDGGVLIPGRYRPMRPELVRGTINGESFVMYDYTPQQYEALIKLTAALATVFPKITIDYPKGPDGKVFPGQLPPEVFARTQGVIGHFHVQDEKYDPGPAFQWDYLIDNARKLMSPQALEANRKARNSPVKPGPLATRPSTRPTTTTAPTQPSRR